MSSTYTPFGRTKAGEEVYSICLSNGILSCEILTYGAVIRSLFVPDRNGNSLDVVLGYDSLQEYENQDGYLGACVGRFANRIAGGRFSLNGREYELDCNDGQNQLHGGSQGFSFKVWELEELAENAVCLTMTSEDGESGYPGKMKVRVKYSLEGSRLCIRYEAQSDADTICSLTNHSYFNLAGHSSGDIMEQEIMINSGRYTPSDAQNIPTGEFSPVDGTPMDLRSFTRIGDNLKSDFAPLVQCRGYDHNYVIDGEPGKLRAAAAARCIDSGVSMAVETTMPGLQFYTANFLDEGRRGKGGCSYGPNSAFCLETQFYPDTPNQPGFPSAVLKAGEKYEHATIIDFSVEM